jgi:predicted transcriptional regulator
MSAPNSTQEPTRARPSIELSPVLSSLLDHISEVTGVTKAGIISGALLDAMPSLLARADALKKRHSELVQISLQKRK